MLHVHAFIHVCMHWHVCTHACFLFVCKYAGIPKRVDQAYLYGGIGIHACTGVDINMRGMLMCGYMHACLHVLSCCVTFIKCFTA